MSSLDHESKPNVIDEKLGYYEDIVDRLEKEKNEELRKLNKMEMFTNFSRSLAKQREFLKLIEELNEKNATLNSQILKFEENIQKLKAKTTKNNRFKGDVEDKLNNENRKENDLKVLYDFLGIQVEKIHQSEDVFAVHLFKLPIKDSEKKFYFEISEKDNKIKVLKSDPPLPEIDQLEQMEKSVNSFLKTILLIRTHIINNYRD